jgi:hypothetical protein
VADANLALLRKIYAAARSGYHPLTQATIDEVVTKA